MSEEKSPRFEVDRRDVGAYCVRDREVGGPVEVEYPGEPPSPGAHCDPADDGLRRVASPLTFVRREHAELFAAALDAAAAPPAAPIDLQVTARVDHSSIAKVVKNKLANEFGLSRADVEAMIAERLEKLVAELRASAQSRFDALLDAWLRQTFTNYARDAIAKMFADKARDAVEFAFKDGLEVAVGWKRPVKGERGET